MGDEKKTFIDMWGDTVDIKDLVMGMGICILFSLGGYLIAPGDPPQPLIFGIVGGVIGFIISSIIIKPKRKITESREDE